jgi:heat shock protein HtpX
MAAGLSTQIWNNNLRSLFLLGTYPVLLAGLVWVVAALIGAVMATGMAADAATTGMNYANAVVTEYWPAIAAVVALWFAVAYVFQGRMIRALSHARPVMRLEEPDLYNLLENLCIAEGMPMPRLEIIETDALNAFASGVDQRSYCVTVTRGLMNTLTREELEAVIAHELTHIQNRDVRLLIVSVIFAGMVGFVAQMVWSYVRFGLYRRGSRDRDARVMLLVLAVAAILWLGYMATMMTRFALSRRREFMADAGAVRMTRRPEAMMAALMRISGRDRIPAVPDDIALMCIENTHKFMGLFTTHPPIEARIRAISDATGTPVPAALAAPNEYAPAPHQPPQNPRNPWRRRF